MKNKHIPWVIIPAILLIDQVTKILVKTTMTLGQSIPVFGDWFLIHFTENYGMAFGFEFSGEYGKLILSIFRIVAVVFIGYYLVYQVKRSSHPGLILCISLIIAGAIGNIIDSAFYGLIFSESLYHKPAVFMPEGGGYGTFLHGKVVDMLYFPIIQGRFPEWVPFRGGETFIFFRPVFNIADSAITTGVFVLIIFQKRFFKKKPETAPVTVDQQLYDDDGQPVTDNTTQGATSHQETDKPVSETGDELSLPANNTGTANDNEQDASNTAAGLNDNYKSNA